MQQAEASNQSKANAFADILYNCATLIPAWTKYIA